MSFDPESLKRRVILTPAPVTVGTPSSTIHLPKKVLRRKPLLKMKAYSDDFVEDKGSYKPLTVGAYIHRSDDKLREIEDEKDDAKLHKLLVQWRKAGIKEGVKDDDLTRYLYEMNMPLLERAKYYPLAPNYPLKRKSKI